MDSASSREGDTDLVPPCNCHELNIADWPWRNGTMQVALCMIYCPYCGMQFPMCFDLQSHLKERRYKTRKLKFVSGLKSLPETSKKKINMWVRFPRILSLSFETWQSQQFKERAQCSQREWQCYFPKDSLWQCSLPKDYIQHESRVQRVLLREFNAGENSKTPKVIKNPTLYLGQSHLYLRAKSKSMIQSCIHHPG